MQIAILIYDRLTALDAVGPYEVLSRLPDAELTFVAQEPGPKRTDTGRLALLADASLAELPNPDIVLVPGGPGQAALMEDGPVHEWLRAAHETSTWTTSVCTGSLILAAAGLLAGRRPPATGRRSRSWAGSAPSRPRSGWCSTASSSPPPECRRGSTWRSRWSQRIAGEQLAQAIQLGIEYDPQPPFDAGSPRKAPAAIVEAVRAHARFEATPA